MEVLYEILLRKTMKTETLDYFDHETQLEAFLAWDDLKPGKKPAVLVAHDWTGRREFAENKAKEMEGKSEEGGREEETGEAGCREN